MPVLAGPTDKPPPGNALTNGVPPLPADDDKRACNLKLFADGAYASRDMKFYCDDRIRTTIPIQLNSTTGKVTHGSLGGSPESPIFRMSSRLLESCAQITLTVAISCA